MMQWFCRCRAERDASAPASGRQNHVGSCLCSVLPTLQNNLKIAFPFHIRLVFLHPEEFIYSMYSKKLSAKTLEISYIKERLNRNGTSGEPSQVDSHFFFSSPQQQRSLQPHHILCTYTNFSFFPFFIPKVFAFICACTTQQPEKSNTNSSKKNGILQPSSPTRGRDPAHAPHTPGRERRGRGARGPHRRLRRRGRLGRRHRAEGSFRLEDERRGVTNLT
ncbi:hypothetical protein F5Y17DRAFT_438360 [Xylariaceae sp. FL0594]|nr:hypothetical protein F5Y17DRAFT_438360 [Xylariaceae sp. FL0594]